MRSPGAWILLLLLLPWAHAQGEREGDPAASLHIAEIHPDPSDGQREFLELRNPTPHHQPLAGWRIEDAAGTTYVFGDRTLPPDGRIVLWTQAPDDNLGPAWGRSAVWNNGGDTAQLFDPTGALVEAVGYGSQATTDTLTVVEEGVSFARERGEWHRTGPTPGGGPSEPEGTLAITITDVPAVVEFLNAPERVLPGDPVQLTVRVIDPNSDAVAWRLSDASGVLHGGQRTGTFTIDALAPDVGPWTLRLEDEDGGVQAAWTVLVGDPIDVTSDGPVRFPPLQPGTAQVTAEGRLRIHNPSESTVTAMIDVTDFIGPGGHVLPAEHLHFQVDGDSISEGLPYEGPLTSLPPIGAGHVQWVEWRLVDLPDSLPAGNYTASYAVVAR